MGEKELKPKDKVVSKNTADDQRADSSSEKKRPRRKAKLFIPILLVVSLFILVFLFILRPAKLDPTDPKSSPTYSPAFFIYSDGKYSLWNSDGVRLSDDQYSAKSAFIGGFAYVKKGREYAIIKDDGSISVAYGKISDMLDSRSGLFLVEDNDGGRALLDGKGKVLLQGDDLTIDAPSSTSTFLLAHTGEKYYVFNYSGILMQQFDQVENNTVKLSNTNDIGLVFYDNHNMVFDNRTGKFLASFDGTQFILDSISDDRSIILLYERDNHSNYKLVKDGKVFDLNEAKNYGIIRDMNLVVAYDNYDEIALLDSDYRISSRVNSNLALKDLRNYATLNDKNAVVIYYRGNPVATFAEGSDLLSGVLLDSNLYIIREDKTYNFYRLNGSLAFEGHAYVSGLFDKNHHTSVSDDGENYFLIDQGGKRLGDFTYSKIYSYSKSYLAVNSDEKQAVISNTGVLLTDFVYSDAANRSIAVDHDIWSLKLDKDAYDIIDTLAKTPLLLSKVNIGDFYANYFTVINDDGGHDFYTYSGYKFYSTEE